MLSDRVCVCAVLRFLRAGSVLDGQGAAAAAAAITSLPSDRSASWSLDTSRHTQLSRLLSRSTQPAPLLCNNCTTEGKGCWLQEGCGALLVALQPAFSCSLAVSSPSPPSLTYCSPAFMTHSSNAACMLLDSSQQHTILGPTKHCLCPH